MKLTPSMLKPPQTRLVPQTEKRGTHTVRLEGKARVYASFLPVDKIEPVVDGSPDKKFFMYGWVNSTSGVSSLVTGPYDDDGGSFAMDVNLTDHQSPWLKLHASVRTKDQQTSNVRTFTLSVGASDLKKLVSGEEDSFCMTDQFMEGNYVRVKLRAANAHDYRNHPASSGDMGKPLIMFGSSALEKIEDSNKIMARISNDIQRNMTMNKISVATGAENFMKGMTRSVPATPPPSAQLFLSLFLGTPAHALMPLYLQPRVRREDHGGTRHSVAIGRWGEFAKRARFSSLAGALCGHARTRGGIEASDPGGVGPLPHPAETHALW